MSPQKNNIGMDFMSNTASNPLLNPASTSNLSQSLLGDVKSAAVVLEVAPDQPIPTAEELALAKNKMIVEAKNLLGDAESGLLSTNTLLTKYFEKISQDRPQAIERVVGVHLLTQHLVDELKAEAEAGTSLNKAKVCYKHNSVVAVGLAAAVIQIILCPQSLSFTSSAAGTLYLTACSASFKCLILTSAQGEFLRKIEDYDALLRDYETKRLAIKQGALTVAADAKDAKLIFRDRASITKLAAIELEIEKLREERNALHLFLIEIENDINYLKKIPGIKPRSPAMHRLDDQHRRIPFLTTDAVIEQFRLENEGCSNINCDEIMQNYVKRVCIVGAALGCLLSAPCWTGSALKLGFSTVLKIVLETIESNYRSMVVGAVAGAVGVSACERARHFMELKLSVIPRINELLDVALKANEALKSNADNKAAACAERRKFKRD